MARRPSIEHTVYGDEPTFNGPVDRLALIHAFNWYNHFGDVKEDRQWVIKYMKANGYTASQIKTYTSNNSKTTQHFCNVARMLLRGAQFENKLDQHIQQVIDTAPKQQAAAVKPVENQLIADVDDVVDRFCQTYKPAELNLQLDKYNRAQIQPAIVYYTNLLEELKLVKTDEQIKQAYSHLSAKQIRNYVAFVQQIVDLLQAKPTKRVVVRKPRKKKQKTAKQVTAKVKCLQHSKKVNCTSIDRTQIVGNSVLYTYNETFNKITVYQTADGRPLEIKGSTITNFDPAKSFTKRIRKAAEVLPKVLSEPRKRLEVLIKQIKAKHDQPTGRITNKTLLLRTFK